MRLMRQPVRFSGQESLVPGSWKPVGQRACGSRRTRRGLPPLPFRGAEARWTSRRWSRCRSCLRPRSAAWSRRHPSPSLGSLSSRAASLTPHQPPPRAQSRCFAAATPSSARQARPGARSSMGSPSCAATIPTFRRSCGGAGSNARSGCHRAIGPRSRQPQPAPTLLMTAPHRRWTAKSVARSAPKRRAAQRRPWTCWRHPRRSAYAKRSPKTAAPWLAGFRPWKADWRPGTRGSRTSKLASVWRSRLCRTSWRLCRSRGSLGRSPRPRSHAWRQRPMVWTCAWRRWSGVHRPERGAPVGSRRLSKPLWRSSGTVWSLWPLRSPAGCRRSLSGPPWLRRHRRSAGA
mmetsp:Transcript_75312/g.232447  ORF Transcript_75312/g.232447 Transcript_75312/m.232447 type:complete len:346 (+) Transcript_75312:435-1472(+)